MYRFVLLGLITFCTCSVAQDLRFRRIGTDDGLPQAYVSQIAQDMHGYLWVGTQDGLGRYDGRRFDVFKNDPQNPASLIGNNVFNVYLGSDRSIYVLTGNGYTRFLPSEGRFQRVSDKELAPRHQPIRCANLRDQDARVMLTDSYGRTWVASVGNGLALKASGSEKAIVFDRNQPLERHLASNDVWALCEDRKGRMWVGMNGGGVAIIDSMRVVARYRYDAINPTSISSDVVRVLFEDNAGSMWIGTHGGGLCQYDPYRNMVPLLKPTQKNIGAKDDFVRGLASDPAGRVFVGLRSGVIQTDTLLASAKMIARWDETYDQIGAARALYAEGEDRLWIGSEHNGIGLLQRASGKIRWFPLGDRQHPYRSMVSCIVRYSAEEVLIGTDDGVALFHTRTFHTQWFSVPMSPVPDNPRVNVSAIVRLSNGEYLLGTEYGLFRGAIGAWTSKLPNTDPKCVRPNVDIIRAIELVNDTAYVATWGGGIRCINLTTLKETLIDSRAGLPNNTIYAVYHTPGRTLVATSNAGVIVWDLTTKRVAHQITQNQGAQSNEFNSWSHLRIGPSTMIFGGIAGVNIFRQSSYSLPPAPAVVVNASGSTQDDLRYRAEAIALSDAWPVVYRVRLISSDTVSYETASPEVVVSTLKPGSYVLEVQAKYAGGAYGRHIQQAFTVRAPLWRSWWFYVGLVGLGGVVVWQASARITRTREQQKREAEQLVEDERIRIARDLHDDVGTGLAKIVIMAENAVSEPDQDAVRLIADTAQEVIDSVRSIVWVMKANDHRLASTIGYVQGKVADLMADKGIDFTYDEQVMSDRNIDTILMRNIVLAVKEIATNIVRHSQATTSSMLVRAVEDSLTIELRDNGRGFERNSNPSGAGLGNLSERMQEVGGRVIIESEINSGTRVVLEIPLRRSIT